MDWCCAVAAWPTWSPRASAAFLMLALPAAVSIYVAVRPVDMRESFNGLWAPVCEQVQEDPKSVRFFASLMASVRG